MNDKDNDKLPWWVVVGMVILCLAIIAFITIEVLWRVAVIKLILQ